MSVANSRRGQAGSKTVDPELTAQAIAKAVYNGNIVDFRFLFLPFSPAREESPERFETLKYSYLLPDDQMENDPAYRDIVAAVRADQTWRHIQSELDANRPAQLPSELLLMLGDNAVRRGKYTSAAQAYELLRIRPRMQEEFQAEADRALERGDIDSAVRGYLIATGLAYDYAAFPEPLPEVPDFQTSALLLHGEFPERPEDCVSMQPDESFVRIALSYLLLSPEAAARLESNSIEVRRAFLKTLVYRRDPRWDEFAARYREALELGRHAQDRFGGNGAQAAASQSNALAQEIESELGEDPRRIPSLLLGRAIPGGEWWQYLKELAYEHPAAALFVCRHLIGDAEVIVPLYREDSSLPAELGLRGSA